MYRQLIILSILQQRHSTCLLGKFQFLLCLGDQMGLQQVLLLSTHRWFDLIWWYMWSLRIATREHETIFLLCAVFCCMVCIMPWSEGSHPVLFRGCTWIVEGCNSRSRSCGLLGEWAIVSRLSELKWSIDWKKSMQWVFLFAIPSLWYWHLKNTNIQGNLLSFFLNALEFSLFSKHHSLNFEKENRVQIELMIAQIVHLVRNLSFKTSKLRKRDKLTI